MAGSETKKMKKTSLTSILPDWSQLPEELLYLISTHLQDNCFNFVLARSVCTSWRSAFPFSSALPSYSLPPFISESKDSFTLEKFPLFLFTLGAPHHATDSPKYLMRAIGRDESEEGNKILSLGHQYKIIGQKLNGLAFVRLNKEGRRGEFVMLLIYSNALLVLTSAEMRWKRLGNVPDSSCTNVVTYRGKFYATFLSRETFVIDPYSLEVTPVALTSGKQELSGSIWQ